MGRWSQWHRQARAQEKRAGGTPGRGGLGASEGRFASSTGAEYVPDLPLPQIRAGEGTFWAVTLTTTESQRLGKLDAREGSAVWAQAPPSAVTPGPGHALTHISGHTRARKAFPSWFQLSQG